MSNKPDVKSSTPETKSADAISPEALRAIQDGIALGIAAAMKAMQPAAPVAPKFVHGEKCSACGQYLMACKLEHDTMVVFPEDDRNVRFFAGIQLNGVTYRSNNRGHKVTVPKHNDIGYRLSKYEENENDQRMGKTATHNSGFMSAKGGMQVNQNIMGWR